VRKRYILIVLLLCAVTLKASKDRPCASGDFKLTVEATKNSYSALEPIRIRLALKNRTSSDVYIVPYLLPFDYWVEKHSEGRWKSLATGIVGPNSQLRETPSLSPPKQSEYLRVRAGESYTTTFDVELNLVTKSPRGEFRLSGVRGHIYSTNSGIKNLGCAVYAPTSASFNVR
jgi:hypothetical protein